MSSPKSPKTKAEQHPKVAAPAPAPEPAFAPAPEPASDPDLDFSRSPHDQYFKSSLRRPEVAADLVAHYLPLEVVALLDLGSLELQEGSFVDDDLREQQGDLLFRTRLLAGGEAYLYLLFEHKSFVYRLTPFQLLRYQVRIWEGDLRRAGRRASALCPIIPIVVYHGKRRWTAPLSLGGLFRSPPALSAFLPEQRYVLLDLQAWKTEQIVGGLLLRVALLMLQAIFRPGLPRNLSAIAALLRELGDQVLREQELRRLLAYAATAGQRLSDTDVAAVATAAEPERGGSIAMTLAEKWLAEGRREGLTLAEKWVAEGRAQGEAEGRAQGEAEGRVQGHTHGLVQGLHVAIEDALAARFGAAGLALLGPVRPLTDPQTLRQLLQTVLRAADLAELREGWGRIMGG